jgi:hypothetical protein
MSHNFIFNGKDEDIESLMIQLEVENQINEGARRKNEHKNVTRVNDNLSNILEIGGPMVGDKFSLSLFSYKCFKSENEAKKVEIAFNELFFPFPYLIFHSPYVCFLDVMKMNCCHL